MTPERMAEIEAGWENINPTVQGLELIIRRAAKRDVMELLSALRESQEANAGEFARGVEAARQEAEYEEKRLDDMMCDPANKNFLNLYQAMSLGAGKAMRRIRALLPAAAPTEGEG